MNVIDDERGDTMPITMSREDEKKKKQLNEKEAVLFRKMGGEFERFLFSENIDKNEFPIEYELSTLLKRMMGDQLDQVSVGRLTEYIGDEGVKELMNAETSIEALYIIKRRLADRVFDKGGKNV